MAIDTEEARASTCGFLQAWVFPGLRTGSEGSGWLQAAAHTYAGTVAPTRAQRLQRDNAYAWGLLGRRSIQGG